MAEIIDVVRESMPAVRLIGKKYSNDDRNQFGTYAHKWCEWFQNGYFDALRRCKGIQGVSDDVIGGIHCPHNGSQFEYWIGMFMAQDDMPPEGFESVDIPAGDVGFCYIYGREDTGELFGMDMCQGSVKKLMEKGWKLSDNGWFIERYNNPRYTQPDEKGNVILDYGAYLK